MGIGNGHHRDHRPPRRALITPHGDWKHDGGGGVCEGRISHYPSWGLETLPAAPAHAPAGDFLITPHGDWKLGQFGEDGGRCCSRSLPLMGIGNRRAYRRCCKHFHPHYPSWGLETAAGAASSPIRPSLITPHGDWKPYCGRLKVAIQVQLITPHGDWKPLRRRRHAGTASRCSHYPSWGLETSDLLVLIVTGARRQRPHPRFRTTATAPRSLRRRTVLGSIWHNM